MSLPQKCSTAQQVFYTYTWVARSRSGSSSFTVIAPDYTFLLLLLLLHSHRPQLPGVRWPEGHLVSAPPLCQPCSASQGQAESGGMVLVAYAGPVRPAAELRNSVLCLPTDIHSLFVNKPSSSSSSSSSAVALGVHLSVHCVSFE